MSSTYSLLWRSGLLNVTAVARRELGAYWVSPLSWVLGIGFVAVISFYGYLQGVVLARLASMDSIFSTVVLLTLFGVPLLTKRLLAEERRSGMAELLFTTPVRSWELVVGKWLGAYIFYLVGIAFTFVYVGLVSELLPNGAALRLFGLALPIANLDYGLVVGGYVGLAALGAMTMAIGMLASSLVRSQEAAALLGMAALLLLWYVGEAAFWLRPPLGPFLDAAAAANRFASFPRGQIAVADLTYFVTVTVGALFVTTRVVASRTWR